MSNRLRHETSPYLLQHAGNPVDWEPWDDVALARARAEQRPILLSIGYSACHWCHVMAHECFEDQATAAVMNRLFVNIKVDREERPDIDRVYQLAHQLYTGRGGGWPLTAFLTPDEHLPIFIGTYFPREPRYGMPGFTDVLTRVSEYAATHAEDIRERGGRLVEALGELDAPADEFNGALDATPIGAARRRLDATYDERCGGFGGAPKFPHAANLELLLELAAGGMPGASEHRDQRAREIAESTLEKMARSGLFDHLRGGFFRYCVDAEWQIPHFEKMLYDNAALLGLYADAFALTRTGVHAETARATAEWAIAEMQAPDGGFYSTLDADSEGEEGKYYVWSRDEARSLLDDEEHAVAGALYGLTGPPNFESTHWHLTQRATLETVARTLEIDTRQAAERAARARAKLLAARAQRVRPHRDEKRIVAWNGLMIAGLARAARRLDEPAWASAATAAVDFVRTRARDAAGLFATYKDGSARHRAYLDDYAFLALGLLELLQCRYRAEDLALALELLDTLLAKFADPDGGFFFTADDHERLIHRSKPLADESIPSGNGVAALVLQAFGHLTGNARYLDAATATVKAALPKLDTYPEAHSTLLRALANELTPPLVIVIRGEDHALRDWQAAANGTYIPRSVTLAIPSGATDLPQLLAGRAPAATTIAYCCEGTVCDRPTSSLAAFRERLGVSQDRGVQ